jgi:hypothetical protein
MTGESEGTPATRGFQGALVLFSVGSGLSVALAVTYNIGYFSTLGIFTAEILSPADIFSSAIAWLPIVAMWMCIGTPITVGIRKVEKAVDRRLGIDRSKTTLAQDFGWNPIYLTIICVGLLAAFIFTDYPRWPALLLAAIVTLWVPGSFLRMERWGWFKTHTIGTIMSVAMGPAVVVLVFASGNLQALTDIETPELKTLLELRTTEDGSYPAYLLRSLDRGLLIKVNATKKIRLVPWDNVIKISAPYSTYDSRSLWCRYVGWHCSPQ